MFSKNRLILILGVLVALMPFSGFPASWKNFFYIAFGLIISTFSFLLARHKRITRRHGPKKERSNINYKKEIVQSDYIEPESELSIESVVPEESTLESVSETPAESIEILEEEEKI